MDFSFFYRGFYAEAWCALRKNASSSRLIWSLSVEHMPWGAPGIDFNRGSLHQFRGKEGRVRHGNDLIIIAVENCAIRTEHHHWQAARVRMRLQHPRRHRADEHSLGGARGSMTADIASGFAAARRMADVNRVFQVERCGEGSKIIGVGFHFVAVPWLAGAAMAATVVRDAAEAAVGKKEHLVLPSVRGEWPAVTENHGLTCAPVLVMNLRAILCRNR